MQPSFCIVIQVCTFLPYCAQQSAKFAESARILVKADQAAEGCFPFKQQRRACDTHQESLMRILDLCVKLSFWHRKAEIVLASCCMAMGFRENALFLGPFREMQVGQRLQRHEIVWRVLQPT